MEKQEYVKRFDTAKRNLFPNRAPNNFVETEYLALNNQSTSAQPAKKKQQSKSPSRFVPSNLTPSKYNKPPPRMPFAFSQGQSQTDDPLAMNSTALTENDKLARLRVMQKKH